MHMRRGSVHWTLDAVGVADREAVVAKLIEKARDGDPAAAKLLLAMAAKQSSGLTSGWHAHGFAWAWRAEAWRQ